jgi:hypothetical protein
MSWPRKIVSTREIILDKYCQLEAGDEYHHDFHLGQIAKFISGPDHFPPHFPIAGVELFASPVDTAEVSMGQSCHCPPWFQVVLLVSSCCQMAQLSATSRGVPTTSTRVKRTPLGHPPPNNAVCISSPYSVAVDLTHPRKIIPGRISYSEVCPTSPSHDQQANRGFVCPPSMG